MSAEALARLELLLREQGGLMASLLGPTPSQVSIDGHGEPARATGAEAPNGSGPVQIVSGPHVDPEDAAGADAPNGPGPAQIAAAGPRAREHAEEYELLVEAIYEGYLLHYGTPRVVRPPEADLGLLAGDQLYALGLARLVALGDLAAVGELADVIALTALAQGEGQVELALAVWDAGARAVGWGSSDAHSRAKALVHAGDPRALGAMRTVARSEVTPPS